MTPVEAVTMGMEGAQQLKAFSDKIMLLAGGAQALIQENEALKKQLEGNKPLEKGAGQDNVTGFPQPKE